jgi:hypothetical protein
MFSAGTVSAVGFNTSSATKQVLGMRMPVGQALHAPVNATTSAALVVDASV